MKGSPSYFQPFLFYMDPCTIIQGIWSPDTFTLHIFSHVSP